MRSSCLAVALLAALGVSAGAQQNNEEFARRQFDSGMSFLQNHRYTEALKDLQAVVDSFGASSVADNALLQIAQYQLEVAHDLDTAQGAVDKLLKDYPDTDSAPMAHVLNGRIAITRGRTAADLDSALASFERVPRLFPGNDAVAAAGFYAGEALRSFRRDGDALERYRRVTMEYPRSIWAARAAVSAGYCLVQQEKPLQALQEFQRVRKLFPSSPAAAEALNLNSIAYRLYLRAPAQPAFSFNKAIGPEKSELRDATGIQFDPTGQLMLGHKNGVTFFKPDGSVAQSVTAVDATAFFLDEQDRVVVARNGTLVTARADSIQFMGPGSDSQLRAVDEIPAAIANDRGERLISNIKQRNVIRSLPNGKFVSVFAQGQVTRMATNWLGDVAMLDRSSHGITVADRDGKVLSKLAQKGTGYELDEPVDLAYDALGHLYVLDKGKSTILVFGPKNRLISSLTIPNNAPGALNRGEALGIDAAGRLYVFDDKSRRIQVYR
ncbi:MAG: tetratricopeptide repeat protein [Acidobacteria bacterium]|nr:tetratricopeptide repeat protein [Acidobacteriota bacterium]